ncbi:MAG: nucleotidyl transferase AbiEii/AbiGii toxin family protein [Ignavibacteria bacterium]
MIEPREISKTASGLGLRDTQIEKDYIIGWVMKGIANNTFLKDKLIFKGGTAIRKIYIKDYRFSEDLDFTYAEENMESNNLKEEFISLNKWVKNQSQIDLEIVDENTNAFGNYSFYLKYNGPLGGRNRSIKVDICKDEKIYNDPELKEILDEYSDSSGTNSILSYTMGEIIAEKMRSLMQRTAPRDLYDVWYLLENEEYEIKDYIPDFKEKAIFKKLDPNQFVTIVEKKINIFKKSWEKQLTDQIKDVPDFDEVMRTLRKHFRKFEKEIK